MNAREGANVSARGRAEQYASTEECLAGGGEMGAMMRAIDWAGTPVGPVSGWSQPFRSMVGLVLRNRFPLCMWWGPKLVQFYNDPFVPILGSKHPAAMGQSGSVCWSEIWPTIGPMIEGPFAGGPATGSEDLSLLIHRNGFFEETHFRVAYSPVPDESVAETGIGGVLATVSETTAQVQADRQFRMSRALAIGAAEAKSERQACERAAATLAENSADVPFSLFYLLEGDTRAVLAATSGFGAVPPDAAPAVIDFAAGDAPAVWLLSDAVAHRRINIVDCLDARFGALPTGPWTEAPRAAIVLPLAAPDQEQPYGVMIAGISPHRALDEGYRSLFELAAGQVVTAIRNARAYEEERQRVDALAQIDRAKTAFFSNVSHEFRTPLALMLGPLEDALASPARTLGGDALDMTRRNALRLLKLVNSLLDFARMESGRVDASFQATDLAQLTVDLASQFQAVMEKGGLRLIVDAPPLAAPAFVDRDMWEKIVLNLLSNAFKHTFEGEVWIALATVADEIQLTVRDTGTGIPDDELPRIFERFHRVRGARTRSHEGTGIGLALVKDLVGLHRGRIEAESRLGMGTLFRVSIPTGSAHLPADRIGAPAQLTPTAVGSAAYVNDALSWLPADDLDGDAFATPASDGVPVSVDAAHGRLLLADDNADMREYLRRLLSASWTVEVVADGQQALDAVRRQRPDLLVADVMMPGLDGLELTRALRADPVMAGLPIILLSARTGEDATAEGLATGANDYIVKPFSARELVARVRVQLEIARSQAGERAHQATRVIEEQFRQVAAATSRAKDEFMAILGHELRNPLAPILTALELMKMRGDVGGARERAIIERQVRHVVRLVDDLLDVSRITGGKITLDRRPVEIAEVISSAAETASPLIEQRQHQLIVNVANSGLMVSADPFRLEQVFSNLLTNAAKFTTPGGIITIAAEMDEETIVVRVKDTGIGIVAALLPRVFDAFAQTAQESDRAMGGLGLGLTIVKSLVVLHGGRVDAHSGGSGKGAEFVVRLPALRSREQVRSPVVPALPSAFDRRAPVRVLVVDDNEDAAMLLSDLLGMKGHEVVVAHDGAAALAACGSFRPDVALLDIGLPGMDGYELAQHLRERYGPSSVRLIAVTGYAEHADRMRSKAAGFDDHFAKPVDIDRLCRAVEAARAGGVSEVVSTDD